MKNAAWSIALDPDAVAFVQSRPRSRTLASAPMDGNANWSAAILALALGTGAGVDAHQHATGTFEVKMTPVEGGESGVVSGHLTGAKTLAGDLTGTSRSDMWTATTAVDGSAGYVAIEKFEGTLKGRKGTFTLLHQGTMRRGGDYQIRVVVVPESGTGELTDISGTMTIRHEPSGLFYDFDYTLPPAK
jgi:hypothetical protein